jgi:hypothetical protein
MQNAFGGPAVCDELLKREMYPVVDADTTGSDVGLTEGEVVQEDEGE